jgi:hypothetical protein
MTAGVRLPLNDALPSHLYRTASARLVWKVVISTWRVKGPTTPDQGYDTQLVTIRL